MNQIGDNLRSAIVNEIKPNIRKRDTSRILTLDVMKILAAFGVVFYHFAYYKLDYGYIAGQDYYPNLNRIIMCFFSYSVPLFFLVNGFLLFKKERDWKKIYYKAFKILVLTVAWSIVGFPSWFFRTLLIIYLLFPGIQYIKKYHYRWFLVIEGLLLLMPFVYNYIVLILRMNGIDRFQVTGFFTMYGLLYFMIGSQMSISKHYNTWYSLLLILSGWGMVVFECVVYTNLDQTVYDGVNHAFPTIGALLLTLGLFQLLARLKIVRWSKIVIVLSSGVLSIYLMHMALIRIIKLCVGSFQVSILPALIISANICIACCFLGKALERIPVLCALIKM